MTLNLTVKIIVSYCYLDIVNAEIVPDGHQPYAL
jgi:hypothetical protein